MSTLTLKQLQDFVRTGAAIRTRVALEPGAGPGTKVFPPTYAGATYATEKRRVPGSDDPVDCVLLDSVQSQANRLEEALQQAIDEDKFKDAGVTLPLIEVDFTEFWDPGSTNAKLTAETRLLEPVGKITSLQAPHRIVDAILRDSLVDEEEFEVGGEKRKKPFRGDKNESSFGQRLRRASAQNATALFELCPTALLLGMWDSTGPKGGLGSKIERAMVSEIVGIKAVQGVKPSSRIDPLGIQKDAGPLYRRKDGDCGYTLDPHEAVDELSKDNTPTGKKILFKTNSKGADVAHNPEEATFPDEGRPSEANHGNVKPDLKDKKGQPFHGGVTITAAEQTVVLSFPALRRLRFPILRKKKDSDEQETVLDQHVDHAARTVLAALGLCAATLASDAGLDLRSRCLLWAKNPLAWELLGKPGIKEEGLTLDADQAIALLKDAIQVAESVGLTWRKKPLRLIPSIDLVRLVVTSQRLALAQGGEGGQ